MHCGCLPCCVPNGICRGSAARAISPPDGKSVPGLSMKQMKGNGSPKDLHMETATDTQPAATTPRTILVAGDDLAFHEIEVMTPNPTGGQILTAAGASREPHT